MKKNRGWSLATRKSLKQSNMKNVYESVVQILFFQVKRNKMEAGAGQLGSTDISGVTRRLSEQAYRAPAEKFKAPAHGKLGRCERERLDGGSVVC